jgi:translation initiation factor eIF-2B subunit alpha
MDTGMNTIDSNSTLYQLVREYMDVMGASRTTLAALKSYIDSVRRLRCTAADFKRLLLELNDVIKNTEPKVIPLVHLIEDFEFEMEPHFGAELEAAKSDAIDILGRKLKQFEAQTEKLTRNCVQSIEQDDFIIAHSPTAYIQQAFVRAHRDEERMFRVLVLKQDFLRTRQLVSALEEHQVEHLVIPEYNLSHYLGAVNKLFIGAVSVSADQKAVTAIGTANVVGLCHVHKIPVHLFVEAIKFAHGPIMTQRIYREEHDKVESDFTFRMTTFSHDIVDLKMVDHVITEDGETHLQPGD